MNLQRALEEQKQQTAPDVQQIPGLLGIPLNGQRRVEVSGRNAYVYVRLRSNQNEVMQAYNNQVAPAYNLPVLLERQGNKYVVIGVDTARYENNWTSQSPFLPRHGNTHSFDLESGGGGDITWIHMRQIVPLLVFPSGSAGADSLVVNPYTLRKDDGTWMYVGNTGTSSLSIYRPTSPTGAIMALLYLDDVSGNPYFLINSGTVFSNTLTGTSQISPYIPQTTSRDQIPLAAIRLITGTSSISWDNIYDVRQWVHAFTSGSSGGISSVTIQDEGASQGTATTFNFIGENVHASVSGSVVRVFVTGSVGGGGINTGTLDARYLKLDASNDPITGALQISTPTGTTSTSLHILHKGSVQMPLQVVHSVTERGDVDNYTASIERTGVSGSVFPFAALTFSDSEPNSQSQVNGEIITAYKNGAERIRIHPYASAAYSNYVWDTDRVRPTGTIHTSWRVSGSAIAHLDVSGTVHSNGSPLIKEAPSNGQGYIRKNAGWETVTGSISVLGSDFQVTASDGTYEDTGLSVTLPGAGTYILDATVRAIVSATNAGAYMVSKLYNSTDAADVANTETLSIYAPTVALYQNSVYINAIITVTASKTIKLYAYRTDGGSYTYSHISSNAAGRTRLRYVKLG